MFAKIMGMKSLITQQQFKIGDADEFVEMAIQFLTRYEEIRKSRDLWMIKYKQLKKQFAKEP